MMKTLQVGHDAFLWKFSTTMFKWTQKLWFGLKP